MPNPLNLQTNIADCQTAEKRTLVLGHAGREHPQAVTVDIDPLHKPNVIHDLNKFPYPFLDDQFEEIICHHVLEHLNDLPPVMNELYRICRPQGSIYIEVPHHTAWCANVPEHKLRFNWYAFDGYTADGENRWLNSRKFKLLKREITFHRRFRQFGLARLFNKFPLEYERFWAYRFPAEHLKVWLQPIKN